MGYSISWLACKDKAPEAVRQELGCVGTGESGKYGKFGHVGGNLPSGWYLLVANRCEAPLISDGVVSQISLGCSAIACSIEEHVMYSCASFWNDGQKIWRVEHQAELGLSHLAVSGDPPHELTRIREAVATKPPKQVKGFDVDYFFDIPLELAKRIAGFKHDEVAPGHLEVLGFVENGLLSKSVRPWWRFW